jgi:hypothetical protein
MRFSLSVAAPLLTFFILPGLFFSPGCKRKDQPLCCEPVLPNGLTGSWGLYQFRGDPPGKVTTVPSDSAVLQFQANFGFETVDNGQVTDSGRYALKDTIVNSAFDTTAIQFGNSAPVAFRLNDDTLYLGLAVGDSVQKIYLKIY